MPTLATATAAFTFKGEIPKCKKTLSVSRLGCHVSPAEPGDTDKAPTMPPSSTDAGAPEGENHIPHIHGTPCPTHPPQNHQHKAVAAA